MVTEDPFDAFLDGLVPPDCACDDEGCVYRVEHMAMAALVAVAKATHGMAMDRDDPLRIALNNLSAIAVQRSVKK